MRAFAVGEMGGGTDGDEANRAQCLKIKSLKIEYLKIKYLRIEYAIHIGLVYKAQPRYSAEQRASIVFTPTSPEQRHAAADRCAVYLLY
jgi:hypothetical protein